MVQSVCVCVCVWRGATRTSPDHRERLSADEEPLLGNRARHGVGGSEREGAENRGSLRREQERRRGGGWGG